MPFASPEMIQLLRCPENGSTLTLLEDSQLKRLNELIESRQLFDRTGQTVSEQLESAVVNQERTWIYAVRDGIVSLIDDKGIAGKVLMMAEANDE